jgi:hypothetical protein
MATIIVVFNDGSSDYTYEVNDLVKAKKYAHQISTGRGCRKRDDDRAIRYFPLHRIKEVKVIPAEGEEEPRPLRG